MLLPGATRSATLGAWTQSRQPSSRVSSDRAAVVGASFPCQPCSSRVGRDDRSSRPASGLVRGVARGGAGRDCRWCLVSSRSRSAVSPPSIGRLRATWPMAGCWATGKRSTTTSTTAASAWARCSWSEPGRAMLVNRRSSRGLATSPSACWSNWASRLVVCRSRMHCTPPSGERRRPPSRVMRTSTRSPFQAWLSW